MMNDIQVTFENNSDTLDLDDNWDPMREEYENPDINAYDHGPGVNLQQSAYRNKNNEVVFKLMCSNIPCTITLEGLLNLLSKFGNPNISKCYQTNGRIEWALVEYRTLREAQNALIGVGSGPYGIKVSYARSDEEDERIKRQREEQKEDWKKMKEAAAVANEAKSLQEPSQGPPALNRNLLKMIGRGFRGKMIVDANRYASEQRAGSRACVWSQGLSDVRLPGNHIYNPKLYRHEVSNRIVQNLVIKAQGSSSRKVEMGRGFIPPKDNANLKSLTGNINEHFIGEDISVPTLACVCCGTETIMKCFRCGTPYCSTECQRRDFNRHRSQCVLKESIDVAMDVNLPTTKSTPLTVRKDLHEEHSAISVPWGKVERNVISLLKSDSTPILTVHAVQQDEYIGSLSFAEICDEVEKLVVNLSASVTYQVAKTTQWPVKSLVAVRCDNSTWRGYILNSPAPGSAENYTVALCDFGTIKEIEPKNIISLPSDYHDLPELAVSCKLGESSPDLVANFTTGKDLQFKVETIANGKATVKVIDPSKGITSLGEVTIVPWKPSNSTEIVPAEFLSPPCEVTITSYHHQKALYVRPTGRSSREKFFTLLQKVAAAHVTAPPLGRPPFKSEMVGCRFRKDGNFYRAVVTGECSMQPLHYSVFFVDFGNIESVSVEDMKALPYDLKVHPCMAVRVSLKGVKDGPLTEAAVHFLDMVVQKEQHLKLEFLPHSTEGVELVFSSDNKSLNAQLNDFLKPDWEHNLSKGIEPHQGEIFLLENLSVLPLLKENLKTGPANIFVTSVFMDGRLTVCPVECPEVEHVLQTLAFQVNEYCESTDPNGRYNPRVYEVCLAKFKDGRWYRGVNWHSSAHECNVLFLDYGNCETVNFKDIRRMVPDFMSTPSLVSLCSIEGFPSSPTADMVERVRELVEVNKVYEVQVLSVIGKGEYHISIPEISNQLQSEFGCRENK